MWTKKKKKKRMWTKMLSKNREEFNLEKFKKFNR